mmetsp:Transcript_10348/g.22176  ORF Transcript_10348/g.22176 Transcript_10348/m.22176 type:complete len:576 (+) Transcript_10348:53-1780(+)
MMRLRMMIPSSFSTRKICLVLLLLLTFIAAFFLASVDTQVVSSDECAAEDAGAPSASCASPLPTDTAAMTPEEEREAAANALFQTSLRAWNGTLIDRVPHDEMTYQRFVKDYQSKRRPVVVTGMYAASPLTEGVDDAQWGWPALRDRFGDVTLETRVASKEESNSGQKRGCSGTGLCEGRPIRLGELLDRFFLNPRHDDDDDDDDDASAAPYPHDLELKEVLPEMFRVYRKPSLVAENLLLPLKAGRDRWPSVFFGANGTRTNLHVDSMGTSFTMAVFRGRKQFLLFDPRDAPALCMERPTPPLDYGVGVDPFRPEFDRCPEARKARALFADVRAGDWLFVPGHLPHAARNLESSAGISQNLLTVYDYPAVMEDFAGYITKLKRKRGTKGKGEPTGVGLDFLTVRDLFKLLSETKFVSDWRRNRNIDDNDRDGIQFWNAEEATKESYHRIKTHLTDVLSQRNATEYATRLAYLSNYDFLVIALKAFGAWDCIGPEGKEELLARVPQAAHDSQNDDTTPNMVEIVQAIFGENVAGNRGGECRDIFERYIHGVTNVQIQRAVTTLEREKGLTKYCCR